MLGKCGICAKGMTYYPYQLKKGRGKYCSRECAKIGIGKTLTGKKQSQFTKDKRADKLRGQKRTMEFRLARSGEKCHLWRGGIWKKNRREYDKYSKTAEWGYWRREVFERDNYICQDCKKSGSKVGRLEPHHIIPIRVLIKNNQLNLIYEVSNGKTLCRECHMKTFGNK